MTVQQQAGVENEKAYGYQGAEGVWTITKDEFEGHKGFSSDLPSCAGSWREIPINFTYTFDSNGNVTGTQTYTRPTFPSTGWTGWIGGAVGQDGKIYCGRHTEKGFLIIDPDVGKAYTFGGRPSWQGNQQESGMVSHPNGKIYTCPAANYGIFEIDPLNKTYYRWYPGTSPGFEVSQSVGGSIYPVQKFCNGVVAPNNNCIYYIPDGADQILKVDPSTRTQTLIGTQCPYQGFEPTNTNYKTWNNSGRHKYIQGVLGKDGNIYMFGNTANNPRISKLDPRTDTVTWNHVEYDGNLYGYNYPSGIIKDASGNDIEKYWSSAIAGPDGLIYLIPDQWPWIYTYDTVGGNKGGLAPQMGSVTTINNNNMQSAAVGTTSGSNPITNANNDQKTCGAVVGADGNIYCGPEKTGAAKILKIYTGKNNGDRYRVNYGYEFIDLQGWTGAYDGFHSAVLAPNGHMYLVPGDTKSTGPQGVVEVHLGTASKPAPWTYGPYITAK